LLRTDIDPELCYLQFIARVTATLGVKLEVTHFLEDYFVAIPFALIENSDIKQ